MANILGPLGEKRNVEVLALIAFLLIFFNSIKAGVSAFKLNQQGIIISNLVNTYIPLLFIVVIGLPMLRGRS